MASSKKTVIKVVGITAGVLLILAVLLYLFLYFVGWFMFEYTEKVTFSDRFKDMISERFGFEIPGEAELLGGEYSPAMAQDPTVEFTFSLDISGDGYRPEEGEDTEDHFYRVILSMLSGDEGYTFEDAETYLFHESLIGEEYGIEFAHKFVYTYRGAEGGESLVYICGSEPDGSVMFFYILCWF